MKTKNLQFIVALLVVGSLVGLVSQVNAEEESKTKSIIKQFHPYVELAPVFSMPVQQSHNDPFPVSFDDDDDVDLGPGGGFHLGVGFDTKWVGVGTKGRLEFFESDSNFGASGPQFIASWDLLELRLFVVDWFREEQSKFRPYLLAGGGFNLNSVGFFGGQGNLGGGFQVQLSEHFYLGGEATYRPMYLGDKSTHNVGLAATVGYRF